MKMNKYKRCQKTKKAESEPEFAEKYTRVLLAGI